MFNATETPSLSDAPEFSEGLSDLAISFRCDAQSLNLPASFGSERV
jgi:hypothetical protein